MCARYSVCWMLWRVGSVSGFRNFRWSSCLVKVRHLMLCMLFCVLLCMLLRMLLCILEAAEGEPRLLEVLE